jgi:acetylornithine deacetylase/succinyl-diaminopimelate desuccinylase-like protein
VKILHAAPAMLVETNAPAVKAAAEALKQTFSRDCAYVRCGGSIPIADAFQSKLLAPVVITGFTLPSCNLHAPDENMSVENYHLGVEAIVRFFHQLAQ